jgi:hypothetical protein
MIWILLKVEALKIRRSLSVLMMLLCPLMVVLLNIGILLKSDNLALGKVQAWQGFWLGSLALWCYFMLPLYIALITALLNGNEHKNHTWRLMLTLPIKQSQLYLAKALLAWAFVFGANLCLMLLCLGAVVLLGLFGYPLRGAFDFPIWFSLLKILVACLPVVVIQHAISWRFANIVAPLALGVIATMGILQIGSSKNWVYFPWSYSLMASNGSESAMQSQAIGLALIVAAVSLLLSVYWLSRREIPY